MSEENTYEMSEDSLTAYLNMTKEALLIHLAEKGYITVDEQEELSKTIMVTAQKPSLISSFFRRGLKKYILITEMSRAVAEHLSKKKKLKGRGIVKLIRGGSE